MRPSVRFLPEGFDLFLVTPERCRGIWEQYRTFRYITDDSSFPKTLSDEENFARFCFWMARPDSLFLQYGQSGLVEAWNLIEGVRANVLVLFWDKKLKGREIHGRRVAQWIVRVANLQRLQANICARNLASIKFAIRMGFLEEGVIRQDWPADGTFYDTHIYGALREEILAWPTEDAGEVPELIGQGAAYGR